MRKIPHKRIGEYLKTALSIIVKHGGSCPYRTILEEMENEIDFSDYEKERHEKSMRVRKEFRACFPNRR